MLAQRSKVTIQHNVLAVVIVEDVDVQHVVIIVAVKLNVVEVDVVDLVNVGRNVEVGQRGHILPTTSPLNPVVCIVRSGLCSSSAGRAVEFDLRSTHSQFPGAPRSVADDAVCLP